ncbi:hypothetical protein LSH36_506g01005 [Paralvinella palmiformis]|uniref:Uncharacterized protein n=1 Tax=Paralvinella palmiformis TaxID=53620 RepID=A0AAD9J979_9ANNE|nr:hypothetical protein LSH36_506g01005 [Paralvinella palmiformis]
MYATEQPTVHTDDSAIKGNLRGIMTVKVKLPTGELVTLFDTTLIKANVSSETVDVGRIGIPLPALPDVKYSNAEVHLLKARIILICYWKISYYVRIDLRIEPYL